MHEIRAPRHRTLLLISLPPGEVKENELGKGSKKTSRWLRSSFPRSSDGKVSLEKLSGHSSKMSWRNCEKIRLYFLPTTRDFDKHLSMCDFLYYTLVCVQDENAAHSHLIFPSELGIFNRWHGTFFFFFARWVPTGTPGLSPAGPLPHTFHLNS